MVVVVEVKEDCAGAGVALKRVHAAIAGVPHEVKAQLPTSAGLLTETLDPLQDLHNTLPVTWPFETFDHKGDARACHDSAHPCSEDTTHISG